MIGHKQIPVLALTFFLLLVFVPDRAHGQEAIAKEERTAADSVFEAELPAFSDEGYAGAVEALLMAYEEATGRRLEPGEKRRAGIKVFTNAGNGLATPQPLVRAVIGALERRGFARDELFILDQEAMKLREAGFLPPLSERAPEAFEGVPVIPFVSEERFNDVWFHESPLPSKQEIIGLFRGEKPQFEPDPLMRKSYLPAPLILECDFWINLPVFMDHPAIGVSGAMANASLWNISNYRRFLRHPASAPVAAAEICAIPELRATWAITLATLERYQYIGGPRYNQYYVADEKRLWLSANPVVLDYLAYRRMNRWRESRGFPLIVPEPPIFRYGQSLGLGNYAPELVEVVKIPVE